MWGQKYFERQSYGNNTQQNNKLQDQVYQNSKSSKKSDLSYFNSLTHFRPMCYSGQGTPFLLINQDWCKSLGCIVFFDIIFIICITMFLVTGNHQTSQPISQPSSEISTKLTLFPATNKQQNENLVILLAAVAVVIMINLSYFLCQFMNPGVRNPAEIPEEEFLKDGRKKCEYCQAYKTEEMSHCKQCDACVWGLDHHCGFFNKCIAGHQKWAFYAFLTSLFGGFLLIIVCIGMIATIQ